MSLCAFFPQQDMNEETHIHVYLAPSAPGGIRQDSGAPEGTAFQKRAKIHLPRGSIWILSDLYHLLILRVPVSKSPLAVNLRRQYIFICSL